MPNQNYDKKANDITYNMYNYIKCYKQNYLARK